MSPPAFLPIILIYFLFKKVACLLNPWTSLQSILQPCVVLLRDVRAPKLS